MQISNLSRIIASTMFGLVLLASSLAGSALAQVAAERDTLLTGEQWESFNESIIKNLSSENEGVREGALKQIAYYGDYMDFPELTVFEVMRMYRDSDDQQTQRLAIVALGNMGSRWAIEFLDMLAPYESNPTLQKTMEDVVKAGRAKHN